MNVTETIIGVINDDNEPQKDEKIPGTTEKELEPLHRVSVGYDNNSSSFVRRIEPTIRFSSGEYTEKIASLNEKIEQTNDEINKLNTDLANCDLQRQTLITSHVLTVGVDGDQKNLQADMANIDEIEASIKKEIQNNELFLQAYREAIDELKAARSAKQYDFFANQKQNLDETLKTEIKKSYKVAKEFHLALIDTLQANENCYYANKRLDINDHNNYIIRENLNELIDNLNFSFRKTNKYFKLDLPIQKYLDDLRDIPRDN